MSSLLSLQVFHCHFNNNFFPLFLEHLLSDNISASTGSVLLGKHQEMSLLNPCLVVSEQGNANHMNMQ